MPRKKKEEVAVENTEIVEAALTVAPTQEAPAPKKRGGRRKKADAESVEEKAKETVKKTSPGNPARKLSFRTS